MASPVRVLGFAGSLRKASFNRGLLRAAAGVLPDGVSLDVMDLDGIPLYDGDVEAAEGFPPTVAAFREAIRSADALLIACPEYNYSVSGVLKNAIDWASRAPDQPFAGKPTAIMGAGGGLGTARAQHHLRQIGVFLDLKILNKPEMMVPAAWEKFDKATGDLTDGPTREKLAALLAALAAWTRTLRGA